MAMQDFSNRKQLDRVVRDLEKIGHVSRVPPDFDTVLNHLTC
jgi:hypothetical protein